MYFGAYGGPLDTMTTFKYLERILTESDNNWPAVVANRKKLRKRWAWLSQIIVREGTDPQTYMT